VCGGGGGSARLPSSAAFSIDFRFETKDGYGLTRNNAEVKTLPSLCSTDLENAVQFFVAFSLCLFLIFSQSL
jgi:hypothetical protein